MRKCYLRAILNTQGEMASVELHKSCYSFYTSKEHVKKFVMKRKTESVCSYEPPTARIRRSQVIEFDFMRQCLFCAKVCEPLNPKHPDRWDRVVQCERRGLKSALPKCKSAFWSREVSLCCHGVHDLAAPEA